MAIVAPFRGLVYNLEKKPDLSRVLAPPYDVISEEEQEALYARDPHNIVRLILGKKKKGDTDWDNRYTRAADLFSRWLSEGILIRAPKPQIYLTSLDYTPGNGEPPVTRWGLILLVRIEDENSRVILPHERTFSAHKQDRLNLMRASNAQFSQIFGLYEDPQDILLAQFPSVASQPAPFSCELSDGTYTRMWPVEDRSLHRQVARFMKDRTILIADGHHRYETARAYRNMMRARYGTRPQNRSFEFVTMYLTNMFHKGLTILPSHRLITRVPGFEQHRFLGLLEHWFDMEAFPLPDAPGPDFFEGLKRRLHQAGLETSAIAFCHQQAREGHLLRLKPGARDALGDDLHPSLKELDVLVLSRLILQKTLGFSKEDLDNEEVFHYESSLSKAVSKVLSGQYVMSFLLNPTKIEQVREVVTHALVMPRKSTFFYPKVLSGMVLTPIDPHEIIQVP